MKFSRKDRQAMALGLIDPSWTESGGEDIVYNRRQRRQYIREVQPSRRVRIYDVGFGLWRRGLARTRDGWAQPGDDASEQRRSERKAAR